MNLWREPKSTLGGLWFFMTILPRVMIMAIRDAIEDAQRR